MFRTLFFAAAVFIPATSHAIAATNIERIRYNVTLFGLPVAHLNMESQLGAGQFSLSGQFGSSGLVRLFDPTDGTISVTGRFNDKSGQPSRYMLAYSSGEKRQLTELRFNGSNISETKNQPPLKKRGKNWVGISAKHLQNVNDPLSAMLQPAKSAAEICTRTIRVFDGEIRADLKLGPAPKKSSFKGADVTCLARFIPIAGYRPNHSTIKFMRDKSQIRIGFRKLKESALYAPIEATIGTKIGTVHIKARN